MNNDPKQTARIQFLARVVRKESNHLLITDQRLFAQTFTPARVSQLETDIDLAEQVEAFVGRFSRMQDTLGDKLLPTLLTALGEQTAAVIDNLDRAERLGWINSADEWLTMRNLRNQMVHEYVEDPLVLLSALQTGHSFVPILITSANNMLKEIEKRGWH